MMKEAQREEENCPCSAQLMMAVVVQLLSCVWFFVTPWTIALPISLSFTISWSLLKLMSIESMLPPNHLVLCCPLLLLPSIFSSIRVFSKESLLCIRWPSIGVSVSASVLPVNIQDWFPLVLTGWISLQSKRLSGEGGKTEIRRWGDGATNRGMRATSIHWNRPEDRFSPRASRETVLPTPWF